MSPGELFSQLRVWVDGYRVLKLGPGDLWHGPFPRNGSFVLYKSEHREDSVGYCLTMYLPPGPHLGLVRIPNYDLEYAWAFRTTK